jgi:hypothetical protein
VVFVPSKDTTMTASGKLQPDGTFTLSTYGGDDGAPAGTYKVRIDPVVENYEKKGAAKKGNVKLPFSFAYTDEDSSKLVAEVKPGKNDLPPFKLLATAAKSAAAQDRD